MGKDTEQEVPLQSTHWFLRQSGACHPQKTQLEATAICRAWRPQFPAALFPFLRDILKSPTPQSFTRS